MESIILLGTHLTSTGLWDRINDGIALCIDSNLRGVVRLNDVGLVEGVRYACPCNPYRYLLAVVQTTSRHIEILGNLRTSAGNISRPHVLSLSDQPDQLTSSYSFKTTFAYNRASGLAPVKGPHETETAVLFPVIVAFE